MGSRCHTLLRSDQCTVQVPSVAFLSKLRDPHARPFGPDLGTPRCAALDDRDPPPAHVHVEADSIADVLWDAIAAVATHTRHVDLGNGPGAAQCRTSLVGSGALDTRGSAVGKKSRDRPLDAGGVEELARPLLRCLHVGSSGDAS